MRKKGGAMTLHLDCRQQESDERQWREFYVVRRLLRWVPMYRCQDGAERELYPGLKFTRRLVALRVTAVAQQQWWDGIWLGQHAPPIQTKQRPQDQPEGAL